MRKILFFILFFQFVALHPGISFATVEVPRNPNSAKECAICHYRWIDTFFLDGRGTDLVPFQSDKVVAEPEMCFSCHDGSVVDSRAKVYNDQHHKVDKAPPADMKIPATFPLDKNGNMQCFTCHTAHGVPSEMGIEKTIFIRTSNENSSMCKLCHTDKNGSTAKGNHPIGPGDKRIPERLIAGGAKAGDQKNEIICETCHTVHGSHNESFLIKSARNSGLCLTCHEDKEIFTPEGKRQPFHVVNVKPVNVIIKKELLDRGAKLGLEGEIICQTCHKVHNSTIEKNLLVIKKDKKSSLCLFCHQDKEYIMNTKHNLEHSAPDEKNLDGKTVEEAGVCSSCHLPHKTPRKFEGDSDYTTLLCLSCHHEGDIAEKAIPKDYRHPLYVNPFEHAKGENGTVLTVITASEDRLSLPLYDKYGMQDKKGKITCTTCHDPHRWRADSTEGEIRKEIKGDHRTSFLRLPSPDVCMECHGHKDTVRNSKHDLAKVAPDAKNSLDQTPAQSGLCATCHMVHGGKKGYLWAREIITKSGFAIQDLCIDCHNENGMAKKKVIKDHSHPVNISLTDKGMTTTLPLFDKDGKLDKEGLMTCETCHDPHRWDPLRIITDNHYETDGNAQNSFLRLENSPEPKLCENCHVNQSYIVQTDHDLITSAPLAKNAAGEIPLESGTCGVCHAVHNGKYKNTLWTQAFGEGDSIMDKMCNACHSPAGSAPDKIPEIASHPEGKLIINKGRDSHDEVNYFPLYDKYSGEPVNVSNISCPSCHNVHQWDPRFHTKGDGTNREGTATNSFLRAQTYSLLCIDCHGLDALFRFKYYHDPNERVEGRRAQGSIRFTP
ncbi:MAG: cytochrome c3 family protein [Nitrospiraceae bacterium]|nr:MAG: cytochrome c3 family protein [Nitrospiraceae bacterium]